MQLKYKKPKEDSNNVTYPLSCSDRKKRALNKLKDKIDVNAMLRERIDEILDLAKKEGFIQEV